ncbi:MAG: hypothetical protein ACTSYB_05925, partial [Candidatus Helarchaeota archaeon]
MVKEKLGFKDRLIAKFGKHWIWWRAKKANGLLLNLAIREVVKSLLEIYGDFPAALQEFYEMGLRAGNDLMFEWLDSVKRLLAKRIEDLTTVIEAAWYSFLGQHVSEITYYEKPAPVHIVWTLDKCILCGGMKQDETLQIDENTLGPDWNYGDFASGVFQAALQMLVDYMELPYKVRVKETKC